MYTDVIEFRDHEEWELCAPVLNNMGCHYPTNKNLIDCDPYIFSVFRAKLEAGNPLYLFIDEYKECTIGTQAPRHLKTVSAFEFVGFSDDPFLANDLDEILKEEVMRL